MTYQKSMADIYGIYIFSDRHFSYLIVVFIRAPLENFKGSAWKGLTKKIPINIWEKDGKF